MRIHSLATGLAVGATLLLGGPAFGSAAPRQVLTLDGTSVALSGDMDAAARDAFGLETGRFIRISGVPAAAQAMELEFDLDGRPVRLELARDSVRAPGYQVLVDDGTGVLRSVAPGPVNTVRGTIDGLPGATVVGGIHAGGLHLTIVRADGRRTHLEPVGDRVPGAVADLHVLYDDGHVAPHGGICGVDDFGGAFGADAGPVEVPDATAGGTLAVAEPACDADFQYFQDYGSVGAVESRINLVINVVNNQYEAQVGITHQITTIVVRSNSNDPYTSSDAQTRLCQFITEWSNNQQGVQRDVAHLFTGVNLNGGTIGIAADIGGTGICVNQGGCSGGTFGTFGSYCLSESDFNGNFGCATDLTAHELGHLWGAFHCSCPSNTMNPSIACANSFSGGSINSISNYRDTRACLDGGSTAPDNDSCNQATLITGNFDAIVDISDATPPPGGSDSQLPSGSPSCQWNGTPEDTHSTVWFRFVATDTSAEIRTCDTTDVEDTIIALYEGSCGALVEVACSEDECGASTFESRICIDGLEVGRTYRVMLGNPGSWAGSQPGLVDLQVTMPCPDIGPVAGACCLPDGTCQPGTTQAECGSLGGTFQGVGSDCGSANCAPVTGACCLPSGGCVQVNDVANCNALGGTFLGAESDCVECDQFLGACCLPSNECVQTTAGNCDLAGGVFSGAGTDCGDVSCGPDCPGDFDGSGQIDFPDVVQLLSVWGPCGGCPEDLDGNGAVDFSDIVNLLAFYGSCVQ